MKNDSKNQYLTSITQLLKEVQILKIDVLSFGQKQGQLQQRLIQRLISADPQAIPFAKKHISQLLFNLRKLSARSQVILKKSFPLKKVVLIPNLDGPQTFQQCKTLVQSISPIYDPREQHLRR